MSNENTLSNDFSMTVKLTQLMETYVPFLLTVAIIAGLLWTAHLFLIKRRADLGNEGKFPRQLSMLGLSFLAIIAIAIALPVNESTRNQVIGLIGLVTSGIFAFSSSTIFANLMAGMMLRVTKPFRTGDFIKVGEHFGRVAERGLLDTEIQNENRRLVALPNTYLITNPVTVVRSSGTIVSTTLSLGYDVHHLLVEPLLLEAAEKSGLQDPFIQILELGDYSISYKVCGMLLETKILLSAQTELNRWVLDTLHKNKIEIMSPAYMNQKRMPEELKVIPKQIRPETSETTAVAEELVFDKAEQAEQTENEKLVLIATIEKAKQELDSSSVTDRARIEQKIENARNKLEVLETMVSEADSIKLKE